MIEIKLPYMNPEQVADEIGNFIVEQLARFGMTGGVIGLSGGVDSTTTAALAKRAFDKYNEKLELVSCLLPSNVNNSADTDDGRRVAEKLGIRYELLNIQPVVDAFRATNPEAFEESYDLGNLMSRIRANILSTKSATEKKCVIGTGNKDEDFGIGYYTLFGDGAVHMSPIGNLSKRLVRQMAEYLGFHETAKREPTAGLEPGQTDAKDLGYGYDAVEIVLEAVAQGLAPEILTEHKQVKETIEPMLAVSKFSTVEQVIDDILKRHYTMALPKMQIVHPPAAEVTLEYR
jgi:NAD+ synthase